MKTQNSFSHLTLQERRIILAGITNGSTKTAIAQTIGKISPPLAKRSNFTELFPISVRCLWNAIIIKNVFMDASVLLTVPSTVLSIAPDATAPLVPAMAVPTGPIAVLINTCTLRKRLIWITAPL